MPTLRKALPLIVFAALVCTEATAAATYQFVYEGRLTQSNGAPYTGSVALKLSFFHGPTETTPVLTITNGLDQVPLSEGVFQIQATIAAADYQRVFSSVDQPVYVQVTDLTHNPKAPFNPQALSMVPYAAKIPVDSSSFTYDSNGKLAFALSSQPGANQFLTRDASGNFVWGTPATATSLQGNTVSGGTPAAGQVLGFSNGQWTPIDLPAGSGGSGSVAAIAATPPLAVSGTASNPHLSLTAATSVANGYLSATDWIAFNNKLSLAGGTLTGPVNWASNDLSSTGNISMAPGKAFLLSNEASDPAGLTAADKGKIWFNSSANQMKYFDGSAIQVVGAAGAGTSLSSLNGLTASTQSFATGNSGTAPAWSSATSVHTLNIPVASAAGVTAGLIANADYQSFAGKLGSIVAGAGLSGGVITGAGTISLPNTGSPSTYTKVTTDAQGRVTSGASLAASDIPNLAASIISSGTLPVAFGGTGLAAAPGSGQLLIGTGTGYVLGSLGAGPTQGVVVNAGSGTITLDTAQDIRTTATPNFAGLLITGLTSSLVKTDSVGNLVAAGSADLTGLLGYAPVNKAGDSMSGSLVLGTNSVITNALRGSPATGNNAAGANLVIAAPNGTGNAGSGSLLFQTAGAGASGTQADSLTTVAALTSGGNLGLGNTNPGSQLDVSGAITERGLSAAPGTSAIGQGVIYFDSSTHHFMVSENGGSYQPLSSGVAATSVTAGAGLSGGSFSTNGTISLPTVGTAGSYAKVITDAYGRIIGATSLAVADLPPLSASAISSGTFGIAQIPGLPATQITSGTLALAVVPSLPASTITSDTLGLAQIPSLPAAQITSGTLALATMPSLPAAQITSGTLALSTVPSLPASAITSGTLNAALLPSLAGSYVALSGSTMTGVLNLPLNGLIAGTNQLVLANGNLGIGTATPAGRLDVAGTICLNGTNCISSWPAGGTTGVTSVAAGIGLSGGPITTAGSLSLATVGVAGTYAKVITDAYGRVTGATSLLSSDLPAVSATTITTGTLAVANGGTGVTSFTNNGIVIGSSSALSATAAGAQYNILTAGSGGVPGFGQVALNQSAAVTGTLAPANGGTGLATLGTANQLVGVVGAGGALEYKTVAGTANEITVSNASGTLQLATPQAIATTSSPTFATVNLTGSLGLGNTNPTSIFDISGALTERGLSVAPSQSATGQGVIYFDSSTHHFMVSENGGGYQPLSSGVAATTVTAGAGLSGGSFSTNGTISLPTVGTAGSYAKVITDAYGRIIGDTSLVLGDLPPLTASSITSGTFSIAQIPGMPATQITSGTLALATVPSLPAGTITSGTLSIAQIPGLSATQITSGTLALATMPSLPAAQITSGTLALSTVPSLPASTITSGTLSAALLPSLAGSYVALSGSTMAGVLNLPLNGLIAGTNQLVLANGNLGIGTATPAGKLDVAGTICLNGTNCISSWPAGGTTGVTSVAAGIGLSGGPITTTGSLSLATVGVAGTYAKVITDAYGRVTGATSLLSSDLPAVSATTITTGTLAVANGGTGVTSFTNNGIVIGSSTALSATAAGAQYNILTAGSGGVPGFGQVALNQSAAVTGTLAPVNGGTGLAALGTANQLVGVVGAGGALEYKTVAGTANEITVSNASGTLQLATPQAIATTSSPTFATVNLTGSLGLGNINPTSIFDISGALTERGLSVAPSQSATGQGVIYFDSSTHHFMVSENGGGYQPLSSGVAATTVTAGAGLSGGSFSTNGTISLPTVGTAGSYAKVITDAYGRIIGATSLVFGDLPPLTASAITSGTFSIAQIPGLPATQITSGTFALATVPSLPAGTITSGTFNIAQIPGLPAGTITSGTLALSTVPSLPASTISSGTLNVAQLPSHSAALITSGTLSASLLPSLAGSYVAVAGSTMSGVLNLPVNGLIAGTNQLVLANGNLGIGTATPAGKLDVAGTICLNGTNCISSWPAAGTTGVTSVAAGIGLSGGPITTTGSLSLATVGVAGTYAKVITDAYGRVTGATSLLSSDLPAVSATTITTGTLAVANGGTGVTSFTNNGIVIGSSTALSATAAGAQYNILTAGSGGVPGFGQVALNQSAAVTGTLAPANGGTGLATLGTANQLVGVVGAGGALEYKTVAGTANEITVSNTSGTLQLATPQAIATTSSPTFVTVNLTGSLGLGNTNPTSIFDISGALTERGLTSAPSQSAVGQGVIYFDSSTHHFMVSENGGGYQPLSSGVAATTVTAGVGLSGGSFSTNGTISLPTVGTAGSYAKVITDAYGRIIGATSLVFGDLPPLTASAISSGTFSIAQIPGLPATQITSGTFALTTVPSLPAGTITSGTFNIAQIPGLPAGTITSGTLALSTVPSLPASTISSGTLNVAQLPSHSAALITSGTISASLLPSLAGSYVAVAGSTMSGVLNLPVNGLIAGTNQLVLANGNLGIGTATPAGKLDVAGTICLNGTNCISSWPAAGTTGVTSVAAGIGLSGGPITSTGSLSLATVGTAGSYAKVITDAYGRVTGATSLLSSDLPAVSATTITTGTLAVANGGTGVTSFTNNGIVIGSSTALSATAAGAQYNILTAGSGGVPGFGQVALNQSAAVTGTLAPANGGTGLATLGTANQLVGVVGAGGALEYKTVAGTANEITVSNTSGTLQLATPQAIATTSSPTFATVNLTGSLGLGNTNPTSIFDISGALTERGLSVAPSQSATGQGVIYFDSSTHHFMVSENGGSYQPLSSGVSATTVTAGAGLSGGSFSTNGTISLPAVGTAGTYAKVVTDSYGRITGSTSLIAGDLPPLSASAITSGTFSLAQVPSLPATQITSGTFALTTIPSLPAGAITSGTLNIAQLPGHSAALITSGTISASLLPSLAGSYVAVTGSTMSGVLNLPVNGLIAGTNQLVLANGNLGIGTVTPAGKLDVAGTICLNGTNCISAWPGGGTTAVTSVTAGVGLIGGPITSTGSLSLATVGTAGAYAKVITDAYGRVTGASTLVPADIPSLPASAIASGTFGLAQIPSLPAAQITSGTLALAMMPSLPAGSITSGTLALATVPSLPAGVITSGTLALTAMPSLPASSITSGTLNVAQLPSHSAALITSGTLSTSVLPSLAGSYVAVAGSTMTGTLNLPLNGIVAGTNQFVLAAGNVGIGTTAPGALLHLNGGSTNLGDAGLIYSMNTTNANTSGTYNNYGGAIGVMPVIGSGVSSMGFALGLAVNAVRSSASDFGALSSDFGELISYGHTGTPARVTTNAYGLDIQPYIGSGTISYNYSLYLGAAVGSGAITNNYALYQADSSAKSYFAGNVGIGTTSPVTGLHVANGNVTVSNSDFVSGTSGSGLYLGPNAGSGTTFSQIQAFGRGNSVVSDLALQLYGGNVGIGTTSPSSLLNITANPGAGTEIPFLTLNATNGGNGAGASIQFQDSGGGYMAALAGLDDGSSDGRLDFRVSSDGAVTGSALTSSSTKMVIRSTGNVGIGTTAPAFNLDVSGGARFTSYATTPHLNAPNNLLIDTGSNAGTITMGGGYLNILPSGNVGIGTTVPGAFFDVRPASNENLIVTAAGNTPNAVRLASVNDVNSTYVPLEIDASATTFMNGNVGIGSSAPTSTLQIVDNSLAVWSIHASSPNVTGYSYGLLINAGTNASDYPLLIQNAGATSNLFWVNGAGNAALAGTLTQSSDLRLKKDIADLPYGLDDVLKMRGVSYRWIDENKGTDQQVGFIAQEVEKIVPEVVHTDKDGWKSIAYANLVPVLVEAVKDEHQQRDDELRLIKAELATKDAEIQQLKAANGELKDFLCAKFPEAAALCRP